MLRIFVASVILVVAPAVSSFARSSHSSSSADIFGKILPIAVVLVVGLIFAAINATKKPKPLSQEKLAQLKAEATEFFDKIEAGKITPPHTPLVLGTDETALLHEPSKLIEARATRVYAGGGTRVRGIYVGGGESTSLQSLKELDSGTLTLTTKRLVFTGSMESRVVNLKDIVSAQPVAGAGAIEISTAKRAKRQVYVVRNPIIWGALLGEVLGPPEDYFWAAKVKPPASTPMKPVVSSADIQFDCPRCGQHLTVEQRGAGMAVNCPSCNEQIEIPRSQTGSIAE